MNLVTQIIGGTPDYDPPVLIPADVGGDAYLNDGKTFLLVENGDAAPINVTVLVQRSSFNVPGLGAVPFENQVIAVPDGEQRWIVVPRSPYNDDAGRVSVEYSAVDNVTVAAVRVPSL